MARTQFGKVPSNEYTRKRIVRCLNCKRTVVMHLTYEVLSGRVSTGTYVHDPHGTCLDEDWINKHEKTLDRA
jgi:hypothetical protein